MEGLGSGKFGFSAFALGPVGVSRKAARRGVLLVSGRLTAIAGSALRAQPGRARRQRQPLEAARATSFFAFGQLQNSWRAWLATSAPVPHQGVGSERHWFRSTQGTEGEA